MKTILLWDRRFADRPPQRLTVDDAIASAAVRAGVAAAADPADAALLATGAALDPGLATDVVLQTGVEGRTITRLLLPYSVVAASASSGLISLVGAPPVPTPVAQAVALTDGRISVIGNSIDGAQYTDGAKRQSNAASYYTWWAWLFGQRTVWVANYAVAGKRMDQYIADGQLASAIADNSRAVCIGDPVNDISAGRTAAQCFADARTMIDAVIAAGKVPIVRNCIGASGWSADQFAARNLYNSLIAAYVGAAKGFLLDAFALCTDGDRRATTWRAGFNQIGDGVHPLTSIAAKAVAKALVAAPFFAGIPARSILPLDAGQPQAFGSNRLTNPLFTTVTGGSTASGFTGDAPLGYAPSRQGSTAASEVLSHAAAAVGNNLVLTDTYTSNITQQTRLAQSQIAGLAAGDKICAVVQVDVPAGAKFFQGIDLRASITVDGAVTNVIDGFCTLGGTGPWPSDEDVTLTMLTPELTIPAGSLTNVEWGSRRYGDMTGQTPPPNGGSVSRLRQAALYKRP